MRPLLIFAQLGERGRRVRDLEHLFSQWYGPLIGLAVVGFVVAVIGHLTSSKTIVVSGILMVFLALLVFPVVLYVRGTP